MTTRRTTILMPTPHQHGRSASFPPKSNPMIRKIEEDVMKIRRLEESSTSEMETLSIGLTGLAGLYKCVDDALSLPLLQQSLARAPPHHAKPLVQASSKLLQLSAACSQILSTLRKAVAHLRSALSTGSNDSISSYMRTRKEMIRGAKGVAMSLRQLESEAAANLGEWSDDQSEVTRVLTCVTIINVSVLDSLLQFLMSKPKPSKQGILSKWGITRKASGKAAALPDKKGNKLSDIDGALHAVSYSSCDADALMIAHRRLENMEVALIDLEDCLSLISSTLTNARASFVTLISL